SRLDRRRCVAHPEAPGRKRAAPAQSSVGGPCVHGTERSMKNLLLLLVLANILYFIWEMVIEEPPEAGVAVIEISKLGPPLQLSEGPRTRQRAEPEPEPEPEAEGGPELEQESEAPPGFGATVSMAPQTDLSAVVGRSCVSIGPFTSGPDAQRV